MLPPIYQFLSMGPLDEAGRSPTIVEIGAARGEDTLRLWSMFPRARFYVFEPDPRNIETLKGILPPQVTLIEAAVSNQIGEATFHMSDGRHNAPEHQGKPWSYSSSLKAPKDHLQVYSWVSFDRTVTVPTTTLDAFVQHHGIQGIDFIWADVQGAEDLMIAGGQQALARTRYLFTEYADRELYSGQITLSQLHERLPGGTDAWKLLYRWPEDVLFKNLRF